MSKHMNKDSQLSFVYNKTLTSYVFQEGNGWTYHVAI